MLFVEHVGRPADDAAHAGRRRAPATTRGCRGARLMARRDPLLPNARIVARREYRDRVRSPFFVDLDDRAHDPRAGRRDGARRDPLAGPPLGDARRWSWPTTRPSPQRAVSVADSILNVPPTGVDPAAWEKTFIVEVAPDEAAADACSPPAMRPGCSSSIAAAGGGARRRLSQRRRRRPGAQPAHGVRGARRRRSSTGPRPSRRTPRSPAGISPSFRMDQVNAPTDAGAVIDPQEVASRSFLGVVFVVLLFLSVIIYGMWVATGVAAEKSSRVMELMISAASPRQLLTGKVVGIGGGRADAVPRDRRSRPWSCSRSRTGSPSGGAWARRASAPRRSCGLTPGLLARVRRVLPARVRAVRAHLRRDGLVREPARRPPDAVAAAEPRRDGRLPHRGRHAERERRRRHDPRLVRAAVQPVRDARAADGRGRRSPGSSRSRSGCCSSAIVVVAVVATRMYEAGVLLYGQRPGLRTFIAAARRAGRPRAAGPGAVRPRRRAAVG